MTPPARHSLAPCAPPGEGHVPVFDELAAAYDATFTATALGQTLREMVWARLDHSFSACGRVLDLGCGTGEDAVRFARRGIHVVAIDASPAMIRIAQQKALSAGCAAQIDFRCVSIEEIHTVLAGESFDGVLSNFGAMNCVHDLHAVIGELADRLVPAGRLFWVIMGRHVPWEWTWYLLRGDWRRAWRRLSPEGARWRGITIAYPTPQEMKRLLRPWFAVSRVAPLGFALPPSYAAAWLERSPQLFTMLRRLERLAQEWTSLASLADHYILEATRRQTRN